MEYTSLVYYVFMEARPNFAKKESRSPRGFLPRPLLRAGETAFRTPPQFPQKNRGGVRSGFPFKESSREVYNYSTKCNLFGIDCSARRVRRAPQGKIRFCFRRKIPEFAPIKI